MRRRPGCASDRRQGCVLDRHGTLWGSAEEGVRDSTGVAGFTNSGLFASHHIKTNVPQRADWQSLADTSQPLLRRRGRQLIEALGFGTQPATADLLR